MSDQSRMINFGMIVDAVSARPPQGWASTEGLRRLWGLVTFWWHFGDILFHLSSQTMAYRWGTWNKNMPESEMRCCFPPTLEGPGVFRVPGPLDSPLSTCCSSHLALATWGGWYQGDHPHQRDPCVPTPQTGSVRQPLGGSRTGLGQDGHRCSPKSR